MLTEFDSVIFFSNFNRILLLFFSYSYYSWFWFCPFWKNHDFTRVCRGTRGDTVIQLLNWPLTKIKLISTLVIDTCKCPKIDIYVLHIFPILVGTIIGFWNTERCFPQMKNSAFPSGVLLSWGFPCQILPLQNIENLTKTSFRRALWSGPAAPSPEGVFWRTLSFAKLYSSPMPQVLLSVLFFPSFPGGYWASHKKIPACTLPEALTYLLDITTPPSQQLLKKLSQLVTAEGDKQRLEVLCQVSLRAGVLFALLSTGPSDALWLCSRSLRIFVVMGFDASVRYSVVLESQPQWEKEGSEAQLGCGSQHLMFPVWFWVGHLPAWFSCLTVVSDDTSLETLPYLCMWRSCRGAGRCFCQRICYPESQRDVALSKVWWVLPPPTRFREAGRGQDLGLHNFMVVPWQGAEKWILLQLLHPHWESRCLGTL